jgi:hypothetical protein
METITNFKLFDVLYRGVCICLFAVVFILAKIPLWMAWLIWSAAVVGGIASTVECVFTVIRLKRADRTSVTRRAKS